MEGTDRWTYCVCGDELHASIVEHVILTHVNGVEIPNSARSCGGAGRKMQFDIRKGLTIDDFELELTHV